MPRRLAHPWAPWWLLHVLERLGFCWADLVFWKNFGGARRIVRRARCAQRMDDGRHTCYCGYWDHADAAEVRHANV